MTAARSIFRCHSLRITGGAFRGRRIATPEGRDVRPTAERVREALFNRLAHGGFGSDGGSTLSGARVLDLFCGTGAMGLEALSRGAAHCTFVDADPSVLRLVDRNAAGLGAGAACCSVGAYLPAGLPAGSFDLVFLDPPYAENLIEPTLTAMVRAGTVRAGGLISVETSARTVLSLPEAIGLLRQQRYGSARLWLLRATA